jgi:hypothetical protein
MSGAEETRMAELFRQVRIRRELPAYLSKVGVAIGREIGSEAVLPLEVSDSLQHAISEHIQTGLALAAGDGHLMLPSSGGATFAKELARQFSRFKEEDILLSLGNHSELPLLKIPAADVSGRFDSLWEMGDTVSIANEDSTRGFMADTYPDDPAQAYEIVSWGIN